MNPSMLESELFGYEGGSFTGARREGKIGLFELAKGGTIFLDEVGDANLELQKHLLRVLQDRRIRRIGGLEQIPVDVRVIAATNRPLFVMVKEDSFRADLFYRIAVLPLTVPPLRERIGDIPILLGHFIGQKSRARDIAVTELLTERALTFLEHYSWPGNVRELINVVEYLAGLYSSENPADYDGLPYFIKDSMPLSSGNNESDEHRHWILETLYYRGGTGRRKLEELAMRTKLGLNGNLIRALLRDLEREGYVKALKGASGTILTQSGIAFLGKAERISGDTFDDL
jgi:transcriptional regulator with PAS, ATPase and Fis domain